MASKKVRVRENPVVRRAQIIDEAIRIIGERGYNGFTVQGLAERCGISNAGLLYYFESKDKLLISLLDEIERREMDAVSPEIAASWPALEGGAEPKPIIAAVTHAVMASFAAKPEIGRFLTVLLAESLDSDHPAHDWFKLAERETLELFERLLSYLVDDPETRARHMLALMHGLQLQWFRSDQGFDIVSKWDKAISDALSLEKSGA